MRIEELLRQDVIEECESPYAAPVVLVPKPNGKVRLCVDYRKLNSVTKVDAYPLPRIDDLLNEATPTSFMSTIDLQSGYHQVKVADVDEDKTAFVCPFGTYRYFHDIIVLSETFEKHLEDLEKVFERLSIFKLHANRDKCHFACDRVKYLGFWIRKDGIEADQEKISAIQKIPVPTNVKEVQSLLQTCSWFRRYVPNFADIARPLSSLTKKKVQWHWGPEQQESFETLKMRLRTSPILKQADGSKRSPFVPTQRNYSTTEREALAIVWALEKLRGYVENQQIFLASDHQPLKWLLSIKSPSGRLARWALKIRSFNLKIDYTPGKANIVADMLSRPSYTEGAASNVCAITVDMPSRKSSDIRKGQLEDEELKKTIDCFESMDKDENFVNYTSRGYLMNQGILYRNSPDSVKKKKLNLYEKFISEYIKTCSECNRYKPTNQKPAGLLRTPAYAQRFETLAVDLFGPLPETPTGKKWIFIVEDTSTKWVELFALAEATDENCAKTLI
ncbi:retrovirus-related Pol polyprotein from transposon 17.6 [Trichonephila clavipes]|nr:retrovirus-related Pol polyprotein from transposon 17.6 [Trichonephila clavipes]